MISRSLTISALAGMYRSAVRISELSRFIANSDSSNSSSLSACTNRVFLVLGATGDDLSRGAGRSEILAAVRGVISLLVISLLTLGGGETGGGVERALAIHQLHVMFIRSWTYTLVGHVATNQEYPSPNQDQYQAGGCRCLGDQAPRIYCLFHRNH
jgi:hypothetical protein